MSLISHTCDSPLGRMLALFSPQGLCLLEFVSGTQGMTREIRQVEALHGKPVQAGPSFELASRLEAQLRAYFVGKLRDFDLPLDFVGTEFQQQVWRGLLQIPYGQTRSYGEQARLLGRPTATRAVAAANGSNKIAIIVPCHRVIGSDGSLTGYGGGLDRKRWLLGLERGEQLLPL